ncbi:MAG: PfkB family carbohydrate kinase, partial [Sarcina sp.]
AILITENDDVIIGKAPVGKVVNSIGAGDSMVAGFVAGYVKNNDFKEAFKRAICAGSASAFSKELATLDEVLVLEKELNWI